MNRSQNFKGRGGNPNYGRSNNEQFSNRGREDYKYYQGTNSASNPGGHAYGHNYGQYHQDHYNREHFNLEAYEGEYDPYRNAMEETDRGYATRPLSRPGQQGSYRDPDNETQQEFYYNQVGSYGHPHQEQWDNDSSHARNYNRFSGGSSEDNDEADFYQGPQRFAHEYREPGYQVESQKEGFGHRSRGYRGSFIDDDEYPQGHAFNRGR